MKLIGLSGYARSGKDEAAAALATLGYEGFAFADKLKEFIREQDPVLFYKGRTQKLSAWLEEMKVSFEEFKVLCPALRENCQDTGMAARRVFGEEFWVDEVMNEVMNADLESLFDDDKEEPFFVIKDVRFPNEADAVRNAGGKVVRVERPGVGPVNDHISDNFTFEADETWVNDGTLAEWWDAVTNKVVG